jgi:hypothetical protein
VLTILATFAVIFFLWLIVSTTFGFVKNLFLPGSSLQGEQLMIQINQPPIPIPDPNSKPYSPDGPLTNATAEEVIRTWLASKAAALGTNHEIENLQQILTGSTLSQWRQIAQQEKAENRYRKYEHNLKIESVEKTDSDPDHAAVQATVKEVTQFYENGRIQKFSNESIRVQYDLIRKQGVWRIQSMSVVNKIKD